MTCTHAGRFFTASRQLTHKRNKGFSLIEVAVILLFISLAMVPIVANISGPGGQYGTGNARVSGSGTTLVGSKHKEITLANALMERLLSGDMSILNSPIGGGTCTNGSVPAVNSGATQTFNCFSTQYNQQVYYQWIVTDRSREFPGNQNSGTNTMGNDFYRATLNIYNNDTWSGTPILTMPTIAFRNTQSPTQPANTTGIVMVLDISGSMDSAGIDASGNDMGSSIRLPYRYSDTGYTPPATIARNLFTNSDLDVVAAANTDDPDTDFDDRYPQNTRLGITNCGNAADPIFGSAASAKWRNICTRYDNPSSPYNNIPGRDIGFTDENLSRIEAARSSLLNFLLTIEKDPTLRNNIRLGFVTYSGTSTTPQVPTALTGSLESANGAGNYVNMRRRLTWLNRTGNSSLDIIASGNTPTWTGVFNAAQLLYNQPSLNGRAIFLVTDGRPTSGNCGSDPGNAGQANACGICMRNRSFSTGIGTVNGLGDSLGNGTFPGANGRTISVYGLGLMEEESIIRPVIENGFTSPTHGDFQYTQSVGEMSAVFENIKYAILKEIIQANGSRYGIEYN